MNRYCERWRARWLWRRLPYRLRTVTYDVFVCGRVTGGPEFCERHA